MKHINILSIETIAIHAYDGLRAPLESRLASDLLKGGKTLWTKCFDNPGQGFSELWEAPFKGTA